MSMRWKRPDNHLKPDKYCVKSQAIEHWVTRGMIAKVPNISMYKSTPRIRRGGDFDLKIKNLDFWGAISHINPFTLANHEAGLWKICEMSA